MAGPLACNMLRKKAMKSEKVNKDEPQRDACCSLRTHFQGLQIPDRRMQEEMKDSVE